MHFIKSNELFTTYVPAEEGFCLCHREGRNDVACSSFYSQQPNPIKTSIQGLLLMVASDGGERERKRNCKTSGVDI